MGAKGAQPKEFALMMFHSPQMPTNSSEEEKLKNTFFAQGGSILLAPLGEPTVHLVKDRGQSLRFKSQRYRAEIHVQLVTPFNSQPAQLDGSVELPLYQPHGKDSELFAKNISSQNAPDFSTPPRPEGISEHRRELAGSTRKQKATSRGPKDDDE